MNTDPDPDDTDDDELFRPDRVNGRRTNPQHACGRFELPPDVGGFIVSDPCYESGTWCTETVADAAPGTWTAYTERADGGDWGLRVGALEVRHADCPARESLEWEEIGDAGVDSGQCGVWRADAPLGSGDYGDEASFYGRACAATSYPVDGTLEEFGVYTESGPSRGGVLAEGAVSSSGYGDGGYPVLAARDSASRVVAVRLEYLDPSGPHVEESLVLERWRDAMRERGERERAREAEFRAMFVRVAGRDVTGK